LGNYYFEDVPDDLTIEVDWVIGACMMVRRSVVDDVGPLDEGYFMYSEELDWCRRIKSAGWRVVYLPASQIIHHTGKSSDQAVVERHVNFQRAKLRYFKKHHGTWAALLIRFILIINYAWQLVVEAAKGVIGHKRDLRWKRVKAYWIVLRSGLPPAGY
jgi:GT2 family glycosyltransferase